jgi:CRISPR/Cas system-associated exonuclease Cas4 (RecB family)
MDEEFELPVEYNGHQYLFKSTLLVFGFTHKFRVDVNGQGIVFEPDEERNYRAVIDYTDIAKNKNIDVELLEQIVDAIEKIVQ